MFDTFADNRLQPWFSLMSNNKYGGIYDITWHLQCLQKPGIGRWDKNWQFQNIETLFKNQS